MRKGFALLAAVFCWLLAIATPSGAVVCSPEEAVSAEEAQRRPEQETIFRGVVESVSAPAGGRQDRGRHASVRVTSVVKGGELADRVSVLGGGADPDSLTSADRFFEPGVEYEFYPRNAREPFLDDGCTQTRRVDGVNHDEDHPALSWAPETPGADDLVASRQSGVASAPNAFGTVGVAAMTLALATQRRRLAAWFPRQARRSIAAFGLVLALGAAMLVGFPGSASAGHNLAGQGRHWGRAVGQAQATPGVQDQTGSTNYATHLQGAIGSWNPTPHVEFVYLLGGAPACNQNAPSYAGVTVCLRAPLPCGNLANALGCAFATLVPGTNHFAHLIIQINPNLATTSNLRRAALCHELGHGLGLDHRTNAATCMLANVDPNFRVPDQHDFDQVFFMTNHVH